MTTRHHSITICDKRNHNINQSTVGVVVCFTSGKIAENRRKNSLRECIFDNMALYFECRITVFLTIWHCILSAE